jgi:FkbM family methyltransferase
MLKYIINLPSYLLRKFRSRKISYSLSGIDLLVTHIFQNKKKGFFIDIGCNHPVYNNNTYLLYKKGWRGINVDLDKQSIDLFNIYRKHDFNKNVAVSSVSKEVDLYFYHNKSAINTLNKTSAEFQKAIPKEVRKITTNTLNSIILASSFADKKVDFLSIDVEGYELEVLKGFDLKKYSPKVIVIEFLDLSLKKLEVVNFKIQTVLDSSVYKYMTDNNYTLVNWIHSDLLFVSKDQYD